MRRLQATQFTQLNMVWNFAVAADVAHHDSHCTFLVLKISNIHCLGLPWNYTKVSIVSGIGGESVCQILCPGVDVEDGSVLEMTR